MYETKKHKLSDETREKLLGLAPQLPRLNIGNESSEYWLGSSEPSEGYNWSQCDIGVTADGQLVICNQSGCSCDGPEEPTPERSFDLGEKFVLEETGYENDLAEALQDLVQVTNVLHDVLVDDIVVPEDIVNLSNMEVRRAVIELVGYERVVAGADLLDESDSDGRLLRLDLSNDEPLILLHVQDPSTDRQYFLRVPPSLTSARQARAWTFGFKAADFQPVVES